MGAAVTVILWMAFGSMGTALLIFTGVPLALTGESAGPGALSMLGWCRVHRAVWR